MHKIAFVLSIALAACGGAKNNVKPAAPAETAGAGHEHGHGAGHEHGGHEHAEGEMHAHGAPGSPVEKFHDHLSPLWHAPEGAQRVTDTCAAAATLHGLAADIVKAGAPAGAAADYLDKAKALESSVGVMHGECDTAERKDFAAKFAAVHDAFHAVAESLGQ